MEGDSGAGQGKKPELKDSLDALVDVAAPLMRDSSRASPPRTAARTTSVRDKESGAGGAHAATRPSATRPRLPASASVPVSLATWQGVSRDGSVDRRTGWRVMGGGGGGGGGGAGGFIGGRGDRDEGGKNEDRLMDDRGWSPWSLGMVPDTRISSPRIDHSVSSPRVDRDNRMPSPRRVPVASSSPPRGARETGVRGAGGRESRVSREDRRIDDRDRVPSPLMDRARSSPRMDQRMPSPRRLVSTSSPPPVHLAAPCPGPTSEQPERARVECTGRYGRGSREEAAYSEPGPQ